MRSLTMVALLLLAAGAVAQHGEAGPGNYPIGYNGDTFTGKVTATTADTITLTYTKKDKAEDFAGRLAGPCSIPRNGSDTGVQASEIPMGTELVAYYEAKKQKVSGVVKKENVIIAIAFVTYKGRTIPENQRKIYPCGDNKYMQFTAH